MTLPYPGSAPNWGTVVSSDGVVTTLLMPQYAAIRIVADFSVAGSPIHLTAGNVYTVTVTEQTTGQAVRGMDGAAAPGGAAVGFDQEVPFGTSLSYIARAYNSAGALLATSTAAATNVQMPADGIATWLKSLQTPTLSVVVETVTEPEWAADISQGVLYAIDREDPIVTQDVRQFDTGSIDVLTRDQAAEAALKALLRSPGPYLLQQPGHGTDDVFVAVGRSSRKRQNNKAWEPFRVWNLPLIEVARPATAGASVSIPGHTYADSTAALPLYSNRTGTYEQRAIS